MWWSEGLFVVVAFVHLTPGIPCSYNDLGSAMTMAARWPTVSQLLTGAEHEFLTHMSLPTEHRTRIHISQPAGALDWPHLA